MSLILVSTMLFLLTGCQPAMPPMGGEMIESTQQAGRPAETQPATSPAVEPGAPDQAARAKPQAANDPVADLLDRLEKSAAELTAFTAKITYEKEDQILGRKELRTGELIYRLDRKTGEKSFAALFDKVIINGKQRDALRHYIFNGRWLAEVDHANKQFIKREIVAPGKTLDPLKLGEGPFPLPIGQPKAEVLARFDVSVATLPATGLLKDLKDVEGLLLIPKPGAKEARDFKSVELFYDKATLLPVGINALEVNGDRKTVRLTEVARNPELNEAAIAKLNINEPDPVEWRVDVQPWHERE